jgi:hypothetical protein
MVAPGRAKWEAGSLFHSSCRDRHGTFHPAVKTRFVLLGIFDSFATTVLIQWQKKVSCDSFCHCCSYSVAHEKSCIIALQKGFCDQRSSSHIECLMLPSTMALQLRRCHEHNRDYERKIVGRMNGLKERLQAHAQLFSLF